jgi:hypothetical protein
MPWRFDRLKIEPERIGAMHLAYEKACEALGLSAASDQITEILVTKIIELASAEDYDPDRLCERALKYFRANLGHTDEPES